jgi:hypothetical protein
LGITPLVLLLDELKLLDERIDELLEDTILLDEDRILKELDMLEELDLIELELTDDELDKPQLPTTPNGEGWLVHVAMEMQLLLFS